MNINAMQKLIEYKDKSKAGENRQKQFAAEWLSYARENGFDENAESWIFSGFEYRLMHPFVDYLREIDDKKAVIFKFLNGKNYSKSRQKSFRMTLNLFAILLAELPTEYECIAMLMRRLPDISTKKEKQRYQDLGTFFDKLFFPELSTNLDLPNIDTYNVKPIVVNDLAALLNDGARASGRAMKDGTKEHKIATAIIAWLLLTPTPELKTATSEAQKASVLPADVSHQSTPNKATDETSGADTEHIMVAKASSASTARNNIPENVPTWKISLRQLKNYIEQQENTILVLRERIGEKDHAADQAASVIMELRENAEQDATEISSLRNCILDLSNQLRARQKEVESLAVTISEKEMEIKERKTYADLISLDSSKQSDEVLRRLSGELASYYEDFVSASGTEMTVEIGEILRDQLSDIYKILKKHGISL